MSLRTINLFLINFSLLKEVFHECKVDWPELRIVISNGLFESVQKFEKYVILDIPSQTLAEVPDVSASITGMGVLSWLDRQNLRKIARKKNKWIF